MILPLHTENTKIAMNNLKTIGLITFTALVGGAAIYTINGLKVAKKAKFVPTFRVFDVNESGISITGEIAVHNPTNRSIEIKKPFISIYVKGGKNGLAFTEPSGEWFNLEPNSTTTIDKVNFTFGWEKILVIVRNLADNKDKKRGQITLEIKIDTSIRKNFIAIDLPTQSKEIDFEIPSKLNDVLALLG